LTGDGGSDLRRSEAAAAHRLSEKGEGEKKWGELGLRTGGGGGTRAAGVAGELVATTVAASACCR
jgi:hypothetical protein